MGMNNRQRRASKAKRRAGRARAGARREPRVEGNDSAGPADSAYSERDIELAATAMALRLLVQRHSDAVATSLDWETLATFTIECQQHAVDDYLAWQVEHLVAGGWNPQDLREIAQRRRSAALGAHLLGVVAALTARHSNVDAEWLAQLGTVRAGAGSAAWASRQALSWGDAVPQLVDLLATLTTLPRIEEVLPRPGTTRTTRPDAHGVDERVLRKVRALLAKAESTEFDDEAEALTAKAQQLMTTHSIERALADSVDAVREAPGVRRVWLDAPYVDAKATLVNAVATSNRVQCVFTELGFVTLIGFGTDLDTVELLTTSLLVQVTRAMRASGSQVNRYGESTTRSFRKSFLLSFAMRIGERLRAAADEAESAADALRGGALVPVLAAREHAVRDAAEAMFPRLTSRAVNSSNRAGWAAGRVAADLASLDIRDSIERTH